MATTAGMMSLRRGLRSVAKREAFGGSSWGKARYPGTTAVWFKYWDGRYSV